MQLVEMVRVLSGEQVHPRLMLVALSLGRYGVELVEEKGVAPFRPGLVMSNECPRASECSRVVVPIAGVELEAIGVRGVLHRLGAAKSTVENSW